MKNSYILFVVIVCGAFTSLAAKSLIGYTHGYGVERRLRETAEEEFNRDDSKFLKVEHRVIETAQEEFDPSNSEFLRDGGVLAWRTR